MSVTSQYKQANNRTIEYAFKRLMLTQKNVALDGMEKLANAALQYLIDAHDSHSMFMLHTTETNTLGWALACDGKVLRSGQHRGDDGSLPGDAEEKAKAIAARTHGYAIILLSEMEGWYREDYEMDFMLDTQFGITENFMKFFKKV